MNKFKIIAVRAAALLLAAGMAVSAAACGKTETEVTEEETSTVEGTVTEEAEETVTEEAESADDEATAEVNERPYYISIASEAPEDDIIYQITEVADGVKVSLPDISTIDSSLFEAYVPTDEEIEEATQEYIDYLLEDVTDDEGNPLEWGDAAAEYYGFESAEEFEEYIHEIYIASCEVDFDTCLDNLKYWYIENTTISNMDETPAEEYLQADIEYVQEQAAMTYHGDTNTAYTYEEYLRDNLAAYYVEGYEDMSDEEMVEAFEEALYELYLEDLKWDYILQALGVEFDLALTQTDYDEYMVYTAYYYDYDYDEFTTYLEENNEPEDLYFSVYMQGVWEYAANQAGIVRE